jgi:hypothetical protein
MALVVSEVAPKKEDINLVDRASSGHSGDAANIDILRSQGSELNGQYC